MKRQPKRILNNDESPKKALTGLSRISAEVEPKRQGTVIGIRFGAMYPTIGEQLHNQGMAFDQKNAERWERYRQAILTLGLGEFLSYQATSKLFNKLMKQILKNCWSATPQKTRKK